MIFNSRTITHKTFKEECFATTTKGVNSVNKSDYNTYSAASIISTDSSVVVSHAVKTDVPYPLYNTVKVYAIQCNDTRVNTFEVFIIEHNSSGVRLIKDKMFRTSSNPKKCYAFIAKNINDLEFTSVEITVVINPKMEKGSKKIINAFSNLFEESLAKVSEIQQILGHSNLLISSNELTVSFETLNRTAINVLFLGSKVHVFAQNEKGRYVKLIVKTSEKPFIPSVHVMMSGFPRSDEGYMVFRNAQSLIYLLRTLIFIGGEEINSTDLEYDGMKENSIVIPRSKFIYGAKDVIFSVYPTGFELSLNQNLLNTDERESVDVSNEELGGTVSDNDFDVLNEPVPDTEVKESEPIEEESDSADDDESEIKDDDLSEGETKLIEHVNETTTAEVDKAVNLDPTKLKGAKDFVKGREDSEI